MPKDYSERISDVFAKHFGGLYWQPHLKTQQFVDTLEDLTALLHDVEKEARVDELEKLLQTGMISSFSKDAFITVPYLNDRITQLQDYSNDTEGA